MSDYELFEKAVTTNCLTVVQQHQKIFRTDATGLFELYLAFLPEENYQHYNCNACKSFINHYGGLVAIDNHGALVPVMWNWRGVPDFFKQSVHNLEQVIQTAKVTGAFITKNHILGSPLTNGWNHLHAVIPSVSVYSSLVLSSDQAEAERNEEYKMVCRAMEKYSLDTVDKAHTILRSGILYRGERLLANIGWFRNLYDMRANPNRIWREVTSAPNNFAHIQGGMLGALLDDVQLGLSTETIKYRFDEKMDPSNYQRSQSAPSEGNILQAAKMVEDLGITESLRRRYARLDEIDPSNAIWMKRSKSRIDTDRAGIFASIQPKAKSEHETMSMPSTVMTWHKFSKDILPEVIEMEACLDNPSVYMAMVTAVNPTSPNILKWGNPFSWYYHGGADAEMKRRVENAGGQFDNNVIRVTLLWNGYTDLDLHATCPDGHIWYSEKHQKGGYLDVDANGIDGRTMTPVENIRWAKRAPTGYYEFYVHTYSSRNERSTPFEIELEVGGKIYKAKGVAGFTGWKETIFRFEYTGEGRPVNVMATKSTQASNTNTGWSSPSGAYLPVTCVVPSPNQWDRKDGKPEVGQDHIFFLLEGMRDTQEAKGRGFFNEMLKGDYRAIRKVLEAYTAQTPIEGGAEATACGLGFAKDREWNLTLKVKTGSYSRQITIDRWE